jgi:hypothetical protein
VRDGSARRLAASLEQAWSDLGSQGYAMIREQAIGVPERCPENLRQNYFNPETLHHDPGDWPVDRDRARDVIRYSWTGDALAVEPFDRITITDRAGIPGERDHARVHLLKDPEAETIIRALLHLVPTQDRQAEGTFGVNLFRTYTNVVTTPHRDKERFVILYIIDRIGDGAETYLYNADEVTDDGGVHGDAVLRRQLNPGDVMIFDDERFKHGTTPLVSPPGGSAQRDALVCTVDYFDTYLGSPGPWTA